MLLAAGLGTRLDPLTRLRAKPAVPFLGQPLIRRLATQVSGATRLVVNLHHLPDSVRRALAGLGGPPVQFSPETALLGTAGGIGLALSRGLLDPSAPVLVVNGKLHTDIPFQSLWEEHRRSGALVTMALLRNRTREAFREVKTRDGRVVGFEEGRDPVSEHPLAFTGVQVLNPQVLAQIRPVESDTIRDVLPPFIEAGEVAAWTTDARWWEFSTCERYLGLHLRARRLGLSDPSQVSVDSLLWPGVRLPEGRTLHRCVVLDGAEVPTGTHAHMVFAPDGIHRLDPEAVLQAEGLP
ncbi:MAG: sugar phosphate nucleotidyltransferase [Myxococcota bacterium]